VTISWFGNCAQFAINFHVSKIRQSVAVKTVSLFSWFQYAYSSHWAVSKWCVKSINSIVCIELQFVFCITFEFHSELV